MKVLDKNEFVQVQGGSCASDAVGAIGAAAAVGAACSPGSVGTGIGAAACVGAVGSAASAASNANASCTAATAGQNNGPTQSDAMGNSGSGGGGGGKVICTELCRNGVIEHNIWMADIRYSRENFSEQIMRGYHFWGIPYVRLMRKSPLFARIAAYPTKWFAEDIAYRMGVLNEPNLKGWVLREMLFRPICSLIGVFTKARDWQALWARGTMQAMTGKPTV